MHWNVTAGKLREANGVARAHPVRHDSARCFLADEAVPCPGRLLAPAAAVCKLSAGDLLLHFVGHVRAAFQGRWRLLRGRGRGFPRGLQAFELHPGADRTFRLRPRVWVAFLKRPILRGGEGRCVEGGDTYLRLARHAARLN